MSHLNTLYRQLGLIHDYSTSYNSMLSALPKINVQFLPGFCIILLVIKRGDDESRI